jgi:hypothetical protein
MMRIITTSATRRVPPLYYRRATPASPHRARPAEIYIAAGPRLHGLAKASGQGHNHFLLDRAAAFGAVDAGFGAMRSSRTKCFAMSRDIAAMRPQLWIVGKADSIQLFGKESTQFGWHLIMRDQ